METRLSKPHSMLAVADIGSCVMWQVGSPLRLEIRFLLVAYGFEALASWHAVSTVLILTIFRLTCWNLQHGSDNCLIAFQSKLSIQTTPEWAMAAGATTTCARRRTAWAV